jgi:hypothetical protein
LLLSLSLLVPLLVLVLVLRVPLHVCGGGARPGDQPGAGRDGSGS